ncbi:MAG: alpha-galactosidase [Bacteroidales bacterium]|nr:alpha-galactosidase [Bacteroidales bacterium]
MKSLLTTFCLAVATVAAGQLHISTPGLSLLLDAEKGSPLEYVYFGPKLSEADIPSVFASEAHTPAYPAYGVGGSPAYGQSYALAARHADGSLATDLRVESSAQTKAADGSVTTRVRMRDTLYPFFVDVCYLTHPDCDVVETWTEISHSEPSAVTLTEYPSLYLPVRRGNVWLSHISGAWGNEGSLNTELLKPGVKSIRNRDGIRNSQAAQAELMLSLDGKPDERSGRTIGAALCYSGNFDLSVNTDLSDRHKLIMGIDPANSAYSLATGETFATPVAAISWSDRGTSGVSRNFHRWGRRHRLSHPDEPRPVLLNSWEGIYFDVNEPVVEKMMQDIADMGGELFVLDDGWFGSKYPRDNDRQGLGDWVVDPRKLPDGIGGLVDSARDKGLRFGLWIEPEMVNSYSELYEAHPDWIIKAPGREPVYGRGGTQLVLDLGNPEVQQHVFDVFDNILTQYPGISYIKWDANMNLKDHGSQYLDADSQSHLLIEWHRGFEKVLKRIRAKYPDVAVQACASGGGRANWGILPYFDEFWVSDNTDPLQRVYMQWGTSYFFPAMTMAQHISASPCHATHRATPIKYRVDVAMSGRLGIELQPSQMTPYEREFCGKAIEVYKEIRPTVQLGDQYRLHSPYDGDGVAALMYVDEPRDHAVFFWYKTEDFHNHHYPRVTMDGLDPDKMYRVTELNAIDAKPLACEGKVFSGRYLMDNGLEMPYRHYPADTDLMSDYSSRVLRLDAINQ